MWGLSGALPAIAKVRDGAPITYLNVLNKTLAPIAILTDALPEGVTGIIPVVEVIVVPAPVVQPDGVHVYEIDISEQPLSVIDKITAGGQIFVPAQDLENPQPGEFVHDPYTQTVVIYDRPRLRAGRPIPLRVGSGIRATGHSAQGGAGGVPNYPTDVVTTALPAWLRELPAVGELRWTRNFEEMPSGSLTIEADSRDADAILERFELGTKLRFLNMMLVVGSYDQEFLPLSEFPQGRVVLTFPLICAWEYYSDLPSPYWGRGVMGTGGIKNEEIELDPDCLATKERASSRQGYGGNEGEEEMVQTSILTLASYVGVPLKLESDRLWGVKFPASTPRDESTNWLSELRSRVRYRESWIKFSDPVQIELCNIFQSRTWKYSEESILSFKNTVQGSVKPFDKANKKKDLTPKHRPDLFSGQITPPPQFRVRDENLKLIPKAYYGHMKVDTDLSGDNINKEEPEPTKNQKPRWKRQSDKTLTLTVGDLEPTEPPDGLSVIRTMDLNHTQSGPTKEVTETTTINGAVSKVHRKKYGLSYVGRQVVNQETGEIYTSAEAFWGQIVDEITDSIYDSSTGYFLGTDTYGWDEKQLKTESSEAPETVDLLGSTDPIDIAISNLYEFHKTPLYGANRLLLKSHRAVYKDTDEAPAYEEYKICNPNGTSRIGYVQDPNWVEPMFVEQELTERDSFYYQLNPESTPEDPLPPYTTGEETSERRMIHTLPAARTPRNTAGVDRYVETIYHARAGNAGFREIAVDGTFSENEGRPGTGNRKNTAWERIDPKEEETPDDETRQRDYRYDLLTEGYTVNSPLNGSVSYPFARGSKSLALKAANTELRIKDFRESVQSSLTVPCNLQIEEGNFVWVTMHGTRYKRRVISVTQTLVFSNDKANGGPLVVSPGTQMTLGLGVIRVGASILKKRLPKPPKPPKPAPPPTPPGEPRRGNLTLGSLNARGLNRKTFGGI